MAKSYRALKPLRVGDSVRQVGELVPEAATWPNLRTYLSSGYLEVEHVPGDEPVPTTTQEEVNQNDGAGSDDAAGDDGIDNGTDEHVGTTRILDGGDDGIFDLRVGVEQPIDFGGTGDATDAPERPADDAGDSGEPGDDSEPAGDDGEPDGAESGDGGSDSETVRRVRVRKNPTGEPSGRRVVRKPSSK